MNRALKNNSQTILFLESGFFVELFITLFQSQSCLIHYSGILDELKCFYDLLPGELTQTDVIMGGGNAIRQNALLRRIIEDRFGKPLRLSDFQEEAAAGAALLAASVVGEGDG